MPVYRLVIKRHGRLIGHFESAVTAGLDDSRDIASRLPGGLDRDACRRSEVLE
ncbi:hypothetical protein D9M72_420620 [compost metagenome]